MSTKVCKFFASCRKNRQHKYSFLHFTTSSTGQRCSTKLVTYGHDGKIADALYLGINEITPTFIKFSFNSKRHIPTEDIQRSKWIYNEQSNLLKLEVFEENSWLDEDKNPCLDNYYHTFFYRIDEQGRIVRLRKGKIVPYKYNYTDHAYDSHLKAVHKRFALQFAPYSERYMKQLQRIGKDTGVGQGQKNRM